MILVAIKVVTGLLALVATKQLYDAYRRIKPACPPLKRGAIALALIAALQFADAIVRTMV